MERREEERRGVEWREEGSRGEEMGWYDMVHKKMTCNKIHRDRQQSILH